MGFGEKLEAILNEKGMSQRELGKKIGLTEGTISRYIKEIRTPKAEYVKRMAEALGCSVSDLLEEEESYALTPKGLAIIALMQVGLISDIHDCRADGFWTLFELSMKENGYVKEAEQALERMEKENGNVD